MYDIKLVFMPVYGRRAPHVFPFYVPSRLAQCVCFKCVSELRGSRQERKRRASLVHLSCNALLEHTGIQYYCTYYTYDKIIIIKLGVSTSFTEPFRNGIVKCLR